MASSCTGCHFRLAPNKSFFPTRRITYLRLRFRTDSPSSTSAHLLLTSSHLSSTTKLSPTTLASPRRNVLLIYDCDSARIRPRPTLLLFFLHLLTFPRRQSFRRQRPRRQLRCFRTSCNLFLDAFFSPSSSTPSLRPPQYYDILGCVRECVASVIIYRCVAALPPWHCSVTRARLLGLHITQACSFSISICLLPPDGQHFLRAHACRASRTLRPTPSAARLRQP